MKSTKEGQARPNPVLHLVNVLRLGDKREGFAVDVLMKRVEVPFMIFGGLDHYNTGFH